MENSAHEYFGYPKTLEELKEKYHEISLHVHPDKIGGDNEAVRLNCDR